MKTAFIGIDYIFDIIHPEGKIARSAEQAMARNIVQKANQALNIAMQKKWLSILVKVGFSPGYYDQPKHSKIFRHAHEIKALESGQKGTNFHPELESSLANLIITKPRVSAFYGTGLDAALRANRIERLVIAGVSTSWAIQSTVREAHDRDYEVFIVEDACAASTEDEHKSSIKLISRISGVICIDELKKL